MFNLFRSDPYLDEFLGTLIRRRGYWCGSLELPPHGNLALLLSGSRKAPDAGALSAARRLPADYQACRTDIETALFEHYQPAQEADGRGEWEGLDGPLPKIADASGVWPFVYPQYVEIKTIGSDQGIELALRVAWDEEHCLGAFIQDANLYELCGSIRSLEYIHSIE